MNSCKLTCFTLYMYCITSFPFVEVIPCVLAPKSSYALKGQGKWCGAVLIFVFYCALSGLYFQGELATQGCGEYALPWAKYAALSGRRVGVSFNNKSYSTDICKDAQLAAIFQEKYFERYPPTYVGGSLLNAKKFIPDANAVY
ncbi:MAG: hypothetical protein ACRC2T_15055 [Thermoguttaceae bacterium]